MKLFITRPVHSAWLVSVACLGVIAGIVIVPMTGNWFTVFGWAVLSCIFFVIGFRKRIIAIVPIIFIGGMVLGAWRGSAPYTQQSAARQLVGSIVKVSGVIAEDPDRDARGRIALRLNNLSSGTQSIAGSAWVAVKTDISLQRSDRVTLSGTAKNGFGTFVFALYDPKIDEVQRPEPGDVALNVRNWFSGGISSAIDEPAASLGAGYLLGQRRGLPEDLDAALMIAGLTHVVVASGYNLTILIRLARRSFAKISKFAALFASSGLIVSFIAVTGLSPSMSRAGVVAGLALLAWYYGRKFHPLVLLPIVAAVSLLINPSYIWGDIGWMLSFAAFAGVMIMAPLLQAFFFGNTPPGTLRQILGETVAATICTLPILLVAFGYVSNVALVANLLIVPLIPLAMLLTFIAGSGALLFPSLATYIGTPAELLLSYMVSVARYFSNLEFAVSEFTVTPFVAGIMYIGIIVACFGLWRITHLDLQQRSIIE